MCYDLMLSIFALVVWAGTLGRGPRFWEFVPEFVCLFVCFWWTVARFGVPDPVFDQRFVCLSWALCPSRSHQKGVQQL